MRRRVLSHTLAGALLCAALLVPMARSASAAPNLNAVHLSLETRAHGLSSPVAIAWRHGDSRMYVAEQTGSVRIVSASGVPKATPVLTETVSNGNEQGLLGLTFSSNGSKIYVDYTGPNGDIHVVEYTMSGDVANVGTRRELLTIAHHTHTNHNGGEVIFGPDGNLYIGTGDGGGGGDPDGNGQNTNSLLGKILRINPAPSGGLQYTIPNGNPFKGQAGKRGEIWMYGLRNPWRFSFDRSDHSMWIGDVGQDLYEEVDHSSAGSGGLNWGWNRREGFHAYNGGTQPPGGRNPVVETSHNDGNCAIIGGYVYRGSAIDDLNGTYVYGDSCRPQLVGVVVSGGNVVAHRDLGLTVGQLTSFGQSPRGELYAASRTGVIYKLTSDSNVGYWIADAAGRVWGYHGAQSCNSFFPTATAPVIGMASTTVGYWTVDRNGVIAACHVHSHGSMAGRSLNAPIVGIARTPSHHGYWLAASDGGVFAFGDADYYGSKGGKHLNQPIVGIAPSHTGKGYYLVASDGGLFTFGDVHFRGSLGGRHLNRPIIAMALSLSGNGYWMVASDGGMFTFGDAVYRGSTGGQVIPAPITSMARTPSGNGYWLVAANGSLYTFGDAHDHGSPIFNTRSLITAIAHN
ncbi:MAG TPA: PQQ-dependent sugar dehydrogenase [Acidimicrobiia bacterium]|nr:PQQ-dependent sugar dehydrogenase [Acidimicrobiia bacterium]